MEEANPINPASSRAIMGLYQEARTRHYGTQFWATSWQSIVTMSIHTAQYGLIKHLLANGSFHKVSKTRPIDKAELLSHDCLSREASLCHASSLVLSCRELQG